MASRFRIMRRATAVAVGLMLFSFSPAQADEPGALDAVRAVVHDSIGEAPTWTDPVEEVVDTVVEVVDTVEDEVPECDPYTSIDGCLGCAGQLCPFECLNPQGAMALVEDIQREEGVGQVSCGKRE